MLVLPRKKNESIVIGEGLEIQVVVIDIRGDKVRLGIESPQEVPVHRREVYEAIQRNQKVTEEKPQLEQFQDHLNSRDYRSAYSVFEKLTQEVPYSDLKKLTDGLAGLIKK